jgi:hypothetical protein
VDLVDQWHSLEISRCDCPENVVDLFWSSTTKMCKNVTLWLWLT